MEVKQPLETILSPNKKKEQMSALSNRFRRTLLGLIYLKQPISNKGISEYVGIKTTTLRYHTKMLHDAELISKSVLPGDMTVYYRLLEHAIAYLKHVNVLQTLDNMGRHSYLNPNLISSLTTIPYAEEANRIANSYECLACGQAFKLIPEMKKCPFCNSTNLIGKLPSIEAYPSYTGRRERVETTALLDGSVIRNYGYTNLFLVPT